MTEVGVVICVGLLVGTVFVRGYTTKILGQQRHACGMQIQEEQRLRQECDQVEILLESAEAQRDQAQLDSEKYRQELQDLLSAIARIESELSTAHDDEDAERP